jgi:hypothetical protein
MTWELVGLLWLTVTGGDRYSEVSKGILISASHPVMLGCLIVLMIIQYSGVTRTVNPRMFLH